MRLEAFRVQNFKKVRDTGWVSCRDLTVFVGKNEAGKSAVFRGLSKLNPSDGEKYDGLKEFPRRRFTDEFSSQDWPAASGRFILSHEEQAELVGICPALKKCTKVTCTRSYSWKLTFEFEPSPGASPVRRKEFAAGLVDVISKVQALIAAEGKGDALGQIKSAMNTELESVRKSQEAQPDQVVPKADIDRAITILANRANETWQKELLEPIWGILGKLSERAGTHEKLAHAELWVGERLPKFIYFDRYDVIDSAVYLPTFVQQLNQNPAPPKVRTTRCLFEHVGLDIKKLAALGQHQPGQGANDQIRRLVDERSIRFSSASNAMTQKFADWWEQRKHKFLYQADGDYFRVWVSDDLDPSEIELDQRSQGMQYFFSFFIVFLVESKGAHRNSILLLDEPGLHMHGTAQAKIVEFLEKLSKDNQTLYSTHSPFMVDVDHLERARAVYEDEDGTTRISEDVWPRDRDSLFPLQAALGYQLAQSLFIAKRQLIVEGLTDLWLIKALDQVLAKRNLTRLRNDIVVVPSAGVSKLLPLASMLIGHDVEVGALLDGDEPARKEGKKLVDKLLAGQDRRCLFIGDFLSNNAYAELEDIFTEEEYLAAVREAYPEVDLSFDVSEAAMVGIVNKLKALFERRKAGTFEKWRAAATLRDRIVVAPEKLSQPTCEVIAKIFDGINRVFPESGAPPK
jgi:predicted ATPase